MVSTTTSPVRSTSSRIDPLDSSAPPIDSLEPVEYDPNERMTGAKHAAEAINRGSQQQDGVELRKQSTIQLTSKERIQEYINVFPKFLLVYINLFCIFLGILSIYWGSIFQRQDRFKNMNMLVVIEDQSFIDNGNTIPGLVGDTMTNMLTTNETALSLGKWEFANLTEFTELANSHNNTITQEIDRQIHHQKYWASIHVLPNTTQQIYHSFSTANSTFVTSGLNQTIQVVYESGRHFSALSQYIFRHLDLIGEIWVRYYVSPFIYQPILNQLNQTQQQALLANNSTRSIFSTFPVFDFIDNRPAKSAAVLGPSELGLIYAQLFSFHQFNFSLEIYQFMRPRLVFKQYIFYRILASQINSLVLALVYSLITIAFQVPVNVTFGHSGFVVLWMFMYLFLSSSAGINENVVSVIFTYDLKQLIAPWMIFNIVINISTTFAPFVLMPGFYKYGYALPMYNTYETLKVLFFDTWKGHLGRNIGVLVIWIVVMNCLLVVNIRWSNNLNKKKATKEKEKKELEKLTKAQEILQQRAKELEHEPKEESSNGSYS